MSYQEEQNRILRVYEKRDSSRSAAERFFGYEGLAHLCRIQERHRETLRLLNQAMHFHSLADKDILDIGCGNGDMLRQFAEWGAAPDRLAGIELRSEAVEAARVLNSTIAVQGGSATSLPWSDEAFDVVCQHTVFTSVLDVAIKKQIASEMQRVLRPGGLILWYDFIFDNPRNPHVRGVGKREIGQLFAGYDIMLRRITLAPFVARTIPDSLLPTLYPLLTAVYPLRTHYLGLLVKPE